MKKKVMEKWVKALRSGEYKQTQGELVSADDSFCCLGVLCNISDVGEWVKYNDLSLDSSEEWYYECPHESTNQWLPNDVMDWAGMNSSIGEMGAEEPLTELNDGGKTFNQIADIIEENYETL